MPIFTLNNKITIPFVSKELDTFVRNSLTIKNPTYIENKKMKRYNGNTPQKLFFFEKVEKTIFAPRGFVPHLRNYCLTNHIPFRIKDQTNIFPEVPFSFHGKLKPFQKETIDYLLPQDIGTLSAPTGSGKTVIGLYLISQRQQPTLIIIHTKELLYQWVDRIKEFLDFQDIGLIGDGKFNVRPITVALVQTLRKHSEVVNNFGHLIADEAHRIPSKTFTEVIKNYSGRYLNGLTATPFRKDGLSKIIELYAGEILHKIEPQTLIKEGHITGVTPIIRYTFFNSELKDPSQDYSTLMQELSKNEARNEMIIQDIFNAVKENETCLVLSDRKLHCEILNVMIQNYKGVKASVLTGNVDANVRKKIVVDINKGKINVLIATGQLIGEGFDCKNLSSLFLTMPINFSGRIIQYIGRLLRPKKGKDTATIYDYFDPKIKCLYSGFNNRQKVYKTLQKT